MPRWWLGMHQAFRASPSTRHRKQVACTLFLLCAAACFDPQVSARRDMDAATSSDSGTLDPSMDGSQGVDTDGSNLDASEGDADGSVRDASLPTTMLTKHPTCSEALPDQLPFAPGQFTGNDDRDEPPTAEICADAAELIGCDSDLACPFYGKCLRTELGTSGFCVKERYCNGSVDYQGVPLPYANGACLACVEPDFKITACCAGVPGIDCRGLPLASESAGVPGALCKLHRDCEVGLVCAAPSDFRWGWSYGRCLCPGVNARDVLDRPDCSALSQPARWASTLGPPLSANCVPGPKQGWVIERVSSSASSNVAAAAGPDGTLQLVFYSQGEVVHMTRSAHGWVRGAVPSFTADGNFALFVDSQGDTHVAEGAPFRSALRYATNRKIPDTSGAEAGTATGWTVESVGEAAGAQSVRLFVDTAGVAHLAYYDAFESQLHYHRRNVGGWSPGELIKVDPPQNGLALVSMAGRMTLVHGVGIDLWRTTLSDLGFDSSVTATNAHAITMGAAVSPSGTLNLAFVGFGVDRILFARVNGMDSGNALPQTAWTQDNPRFRSEPIEVDFALDPVGTPWIAHTAPEGILLNVLKDSAWLGTVVATNASAPELVVDTAGEPHVFYGVSGELRHAHRGSCP